MSPAAKQRLFFLVKLVVTAGLVGWLVRSGALDMGALSLFLEQKSLLAMDLAVFFLASVLIATVRWRVLLGLADVRVPFLRAVQLQFVSLFFNVVIPGNVGGDVIKALYVAGDGHAEKRTTLLLIAFVERLVGLGGLVTMGLVMVLFRGQTLWASPLFRPMVTSVLILGAGFVLGPAVFVGLMRRFGARMELWASGTSPISRLLRNLVASFRLVSERPWRLICALGLSMALHFVNMSFFTFLTGVVGKEEVTFSAIASIYPLGLLSMMLPVSAAGIGVGHVAFDRLFTAVGLAHGATVFNLFFFGQIAPCVLGVFPYLSLRAKTQAAVADGVPPSTT